MAVGMASVLRDAADSAAGLCDAAEGGLERGWQRASFKHDKRSALAGKVGVRAS